MGAAAKPALGIPALDQNKYYDLYEFHAWQSLYQVTGQRDSAASDVSFFAHIVKYTLQQVELNTWNLFAFLVMFSQNICSCGFFR